MSLWQMLPKRVPSNILISRRYIKDMEVPFVVLSILFAFHVFLAMPQNGKLLLQRK